MADPPQPDWNRIYNVILQAQEGAISAGKAIELIREDWGSPGPQEPSEPICANCGFTEKLHRLYDAAAPHGDIPCHDFRASAPATAPEPSEEERDFELEEIQDRIAEDAADRAAALRAGPADDALHRIWATYWDLGDDRSRLQKMHDIACEALEAARAPASPPELAALSRVLGEVRRHLPALSPAGKILLRDRLMAELRVEAKARG